jgi:DNA repair ATPase RecN
MSYAISRGGLAVLAVLLLAGPARAQEEAPDTFVPLPQDSVQTALAEFQILNTRVNEVQVQALEANPELQQEQAAIQSEIEIAVFEARPDLKTALQERLPAMQQEAAAAEEVQDTAQLQALNEEYQGIMARVEEAQAEVVEEEDLRERLSGFQDRVMDAMAQVDPTIEGVFERLRALAGRLDATLGG